MLKMQSRSMPIKDNTQATKTVKLDRQPAPTKWKQAVAALAVVALLGHSACAQQLRTRTRYQLHSGDQLTVNFQYTPEFNQSVTIQPDGFVVLTAGGEAKIEGLTLDEAKALIEKTTSVRLKDPVVNLILTDFQKPYFVVAGEVVNPARYELRENISALQALMMAGGTKVTGKDTQVVVLRAFSSGVPEVRVLNLKDPHSKAILEHDLELEPGDIVYVPRNRVTKFSAVLQAGAVAAVYANLATTAVR